MAPWPLAQKYSAAQCVKVPAPLPSVHPTTCPAYCRRPSTRRRVVLWRRGSASLLVVEARWPLGLWPNNTRQLSVRRCQPRCRRFVTLVLRRRWEGDPTRQLLSASALPAFHRPPPKEVPTSVATGVLVRPTQPGQVRQRPNTCRGATTPAVGCGHSALGFAECLTRCRRCARFSARATMPRRGRRGEASRSVQPWLITRGRSQGPDSDRAPLE